MNQKIQEYYNQYKVFVKNINLPNIVPVFDISKAHINASFAYIDVDELNNSTIILYIDENLFQYNERFCKSILFHEFTHVLDGVQTFKKIRLSDIEKFNKIMATYSEYHASQIEILCNIGYKKVKPISKRFNISDKVYFKDDLVDIENYIIYPLANASVILNKDKYAYFDLKDIEYNIKYLMAEKSIMYYLGKYSVCEKYANKKPHDFFHEFSEFEQDVLLMYKSLKSKDIDRILGTVDDFMLHFMKYFKFKIA